MNYNICLMGIGGFIFKDGRFYVIDMFGFGVSFDFESFGVVVVDWVL